MVRARCGAQQTRRQQTMPATPNLSDAALIDMIGEAEAVQRTLAAKLKGLRKEAEERGLDHRQQG